MSTFAYVAECYGVCSRKFVELHKDRCGGCTTAKAIWENTKSSDPLSTHIHDGEITISIHCTCCTVYKDWKKNHPNESEKLQQYADKPFHYTVCPDKQVKCWNRGNWLRTQALFTPQNVLALRVPMVTIHICVRTALN